MLSLLLILTLSVYGQDEGAAVEEVIQQQEEQIIDEAAQSQEQELPAENNPQEVVNDAEAGGSQTQVEKEVSQIQNYLKPFWYDRVRYRDPFEVQGPSAPLEPGQVYGPFLPLQTSNLEEFTLKGLLWKTKKPVAIFVDGDGKEHRLTIKDYIGENFGYIAMIREREVVIIQTIEEDGKRYSTTKVVFLETKS